MGKQVDKCTIISGSPERDIDFINSNIDRDSYIICADSGYLCCRELNIIPDMIIGDFDSSSYPEIDTDIVKLNNEKAYTDTFHCVIEAVNKNFKYIEIFNAIGNRVDHTYSNILCLNYCKNNNVECSILNRNNMLSLITSQKKIYKDYDNFSLFAYGEKCSGVKIEGAYYTAGFYDKDLLDFELDSQFGVSNFVCDDYAVVSVKKGCLLLIESND